MRKQTGNIFCFTHRCHSFVLWNLPGTHTGTRLARCLCRSRCSDRADESHSSSGLKQRHVWLYSRDRIKMYTSGRQRAVCGPQLAPELKVFPHVSRHMCSCLWVPVKWVFCYYFWKIITSGLIYDQNCFINQLHPWMNEINKYIRNISCHCACTTSAHDWPLMLDPCRKSRFNRTGQMDTCVSVCECSRACVCVCDCMEAEVATSVLTVQAERPCCLQYWGLLNLCSH